MQDQFFSIFVGGLLLEARFFFKFAQKISIFGIQTGEWASNRDFTILPLFLTSPLGPSNACKMILNVLKHIVLFKFVSKYHISPSVWCFPYM